VDSGGARPFESWAIFRRPDGSEYLWESRNHRKVAGQGAASGFMSRKDALRSALSSLTTVVSCVSSIAGLINPASYKNCKTLSLRAPYNLGNTVSVRGRPTARASEPSAEPRRLLSGALVFYLQLSLSLLVCGLSLDHVAVC
jgi:hypothetical protein